MKNRALFLDRDGILNREQDYVLRAEDLHVNPEILPLLRAARDKAYALIVITNQAALAKDLLTSAEYARITQKITDWLSGEGLLLTGVMTCPYHPEGKGALKRDSFFRKPYPGMLLEAAGRYNIDLAQSYFIGDQDRDRQAGLAAGVKEFFLYSEGRTDVLQELIEKL